MKATKYYFESHITIEPVFNAERAEVVEIADQYGFKMAKLWMQKKPFGFSELSKKDTLLTAHSLELNDITERMKACVIHLHNKNYKIYRYKIEDIVMDSRSEDVLMLLS